MDEFSNTIDLGFSVARFNVNRQTLEVFTPGDFSENVAVPHQYIYIANPEKLCDFLNAHLRKDCKEETSA